MLVWVAALVNGSNPVLVAETFGGGFRDLAKFTLQMASPRGAVAFVPPVAP